MKGSEAFALTSLPGGFSLVALPCRRRIYRIERLLRSLTHGSYGPALRRLHAGAVVRSDTTVDSTLRAGGGPGALRFAASKERSR